MAESLRDRFARIVDLARATLHEIQSSQEIDAERAILSIEGERLLYRIVLKETISAKGRRYAYYILRGERVLLGLDNHPDRQALRLRFGAAFAEHLADLIPHQHSADKTSVSLTPPWTAMQFLNELHVLFADLIDEDERREG